jgi:hypothetical protein
MTTVIDSLVLEFGLDTAKFTKQQREAIDNLRKFEAEAEKIGGRAEQQTKKTVDMMSALRREVVGVAAAFLGARGVQSFLQNLNSADAAAGRLALTMNMSTKELLTWDAAAQQAGAKAGEMKSTLNAMNAELGRYLITGQSELVGILGQLGVDMYDEFGKLKDAAAIYKDVVSAMDARNLTPQQRASTLSMFPGMSEGSMAMLIKARAELEEYLRISRAIVNVTDDGVNKAQQYERAVANLETAFGRLGRTITTAAAPALTGLANIWTDTLTGGDKALYKLDKESLLAKLMDPNKTKMQALKEWYNGPSQVAPTPSPPAAGTRTAPQSKSEVEAFVRAEAIKRNIDPNVAMRVVQSEGLNNYVGDAGTSFGPFQLHYGGIRPGPLAAKGLGDAFTKTTGLDARDPTTWQDQVRFSLDHAANSGRGWLDWYGAKNTGIGQFEGIGKRSSSSKSTTVNIGTMNIDTKATNSDEIAKDIKPALERQIDTSQFNTSLN